MVTGGGRGIGAAVALELGRLGADLTLMGRTLNALEAVASDVRDGCGVRAQALVVDVTDELGEPVPSRPPRRCWGRRWCSSTTPASPGSAPFKRMDLTHWRQMLDVNATGTFLCTRRGGWTG